jgi:TonB family protein
MSARALFAAVSLALLGVPSSGFPQELSRPAVGIVSPTSNSVMLVARSEQAPAAVATNPPIDIPFYPDTAQGLQKLMKDMMKIEKQDKQQELALFAKSLLLPDADNWFKSVFGDVAGAALTSASKQARARTEPGARETLAMLRKQHLAEVRAVRFDDSCNPLATPTEYPFLLLRQHAEPLYDVRFSDGSNESVWAYFAYVDGSFRFIGNLKRSNAGYPFQGRETQSLGDKSSETEGKTKDRIRVAGNVQQATLIHQDIPKYPQDAKDNHIQGTVLLHAVIGKDGTILFLDLSEGVCALAGSAMEAVKNWRYKPTLLNGEPVEVDTTISVIYTLSR